MSGVDNRIVTMKFDNRDFEKNAQTSMSTLQKLKSSMDFGAIAGGTIRALGMIESALSRIGLKTPFSPMIRAANMGLAGVGGVLDKLGMRNPFATSTTGAQDLGHAAAQAGGPGGMGVLHGAVTGVSSKFIALSTIAITTLSNITNRAVNAGIAFGKSFSIGPIMDGLHEYETNLKAIQTVQANTDRPLPEINKALEQLNAYSDQTIYNFGEMAKNVGTFTAAGVDLKTSVSSIKGIANMAALSGSSSEQAAGAMYQLSQAISSGKVGLMDWNSVVNAGMGGKKLQNALAQTAIAMGDISKESVKLSKTTGQLTINGGSFRESIMAKPGEKPWLSSEILVNTLASLDGRFSVAAQKAELTEKGVRKFTDAQIKSNMAEARANLEKKNGVKYSDEQYKALQKLSTQAFESATKVKTLGQVFDIARETIGSGWSASFKNVFGDLKQAKKLFTGMSNGLNDIIKRGALARNNLLKAWSGSEIGGRDMLIQAFKNAWEALLKILGPIKRGFHDIFPKTTVKDLRNMTIAFQAFTDRLIPSKETMADIRDIAGGVFSVFSIGGKIISGIVTMFKTLFDSMGAGNGDFLDFAAGVGNSVKSFDAFLEKSGIIEKFFIGLGNILSVPLALIQGVASAIASIFDGFDFGKANGATGAIEGATEGLSKLSGVADGIRGFFAGLSGMFQGLGEAIGKGLVGIGDLIAKFLTSESFGPALDAINTGLFAAITVMIVKFFKGGSIDLTGGIFSQMADTLDGVTGSLTALQTNLKANALLKIGISIAVLAAALLVLSTIDPGDLRKALGAMTAGFAVLIAAMVAMMKVLGPVGIIQLYAVSAAMTNMAGAILILALALKTLASINFGDMLRGLVGLGIMLRILTKAMVPLAAGSKGMMRAAASLILLGIAINILAVALKIFATMSWAEMIKGLAGLTGVLIALSIGLRAMPALEAQAVTLIALGVAINLLSVALLVFATMSWTEMAKGLLMLTGALVGIGLGLRAMPKGVLLQSVALVAIAGAMVVLAGALKIMGSMGWEEIGKGMVVLGGAMLILAVGLQAIGVVGTVGAIGLVAAAGAMAIFAPIMLAFGAMKWESIAKSMAMLAGVFVILGVAGYALAPVTPVLLGLGASLVLIGAGLFLAASAALLAATAFGIVVGVGAAGVQVLVALLGAIVAAIPPALAAFGEGVVQFAVAIGQGAPAIATAFGQILINLINQVIRVTPRLGRMFLVMLNTALRVIVTAVPRIANAGLRVIIGFLSAIERNIYKITTLAIRIITGFIDGVADNLDRIIQSGVNLILKFIQGLTKAIDNNAEELGRAGADLGMAIIRGLASGIAGGADEIKDGLVDIAKGALDSAKDFLSIGSPSKVFRDEVGAAIPRGMALGVKDKTPLVVAEIGNMGRSAVGQMSTIMNGINDAFYLDPNLNPTVTPVLDLSRLTQEANKMSSILATAPIMPTMSYQTAADISAQTQASAEYDDGPTGGNGGGGGDTYVNLEQNLHSPTPIDSVASYRAGKSLISLVKEAL